MIGGLGPEPFLRVDFSPCLPVACCSRPLRHYETIAPLASGDLFARRTPLSAALKTCLWQKPSNSDIDFTRPKDDAKKKPIVFHDLSWCDLRVL